MFTRKNLVGGILVIATIGILVGAPAPAADDTPLTKEQIKQFLLTAEVIASKESKKGVTHPTRLTLSNGSIMHDASYQPIDQHKSEMKLESGATVFNFVDSYKFNIAAYTLSEMLGIDDMLPVYVERKWQGHAGSLSWWLPVKMDEEERLAKKITPPNLDAWNKQMYRVRVFDELIYDTDANLNVLIGPDWQIWRIDFTRAFRANKDLHKPADLVQCDRHLFAKLKELNGNELEEKTRHYLTKEEVQAVMARRDKIVARFDDLIKERGRKKYSTERTRHAKAALSAMLLVTVSGYPGSIVSGDTVVNKGSCPFPLVLSDTLTLARIALSSPGVSQG